MAEASGNNKSISNVALDKRQVDLGKVLGGSKRQGGGGKRDVNEKGRWPMWTSGGRTGLSAQGI